MAKPRLGAEYPPAAPFALLAAAFLPATLGCALSAGSTTAAPQTTSSAAGGTSFPAAPAADDDSGFADSAGQEEGSRSGLVADLDRLQDAADDPEPVTGDGTDSVTTAAAPLAIDPAVAERLTTFGELHLGYDHRADPAERADALALLVSADLFDELATPLPPALVEELAREEYVVRPQLSSLESVERLTNGGAVYRLDFELETSTVAAPGDDPDTSTGRATLVLVVGVDGLIEDVR